MDSNLLARVTTLALLLVWDTRVKHMSVRTMIRRIIWRGRAVHRGRGCQPPKAITGCRSSPPA
jgi:hypothetical protein